MLTVTYWNLTRRIFLGNIEGLRTTASSRINSHADLNTIDETRGNITVKEGDLLVNEKIIDRQTHAHHKVTGQNAPQEIPEFLCGHVPAQPHNHKK